MTNPTLFQQLEAMRPALLRFALLQLRNPELAEELELKIREVLKSKA